MRIKYSTQQVDLERNHHLPGETVDQHSHDPLELMLSCFFTAEQLLDLEFLAVMLILLAITISSPLFWMLGRPRGC